ncbi:MAG: polysaccharide pyruvyl transferase family protein [Luteolibacter sp.]
MSNKPPTIEIFGTGTHNRGAELMALAIAQRVRQRFPSARIVVPPQLWDFESRTRNGFFLNWDYVGKLAKTRCLLTKAASRRFPNVCGMIPPDEVDVVLDASGFAFSDQWGPETARILLRKMERAERKSQRLVFMPQAFGPFRNPEVARTCKDLLNRADLVFARDPKSLSEVRELGLSTDVILSPDFTVGLPATACRFQGLPKTYSAIVPNRRMMDKTTDQETYLSFIRTAVDMLRNAGLNPIFVLHDAKEDAKVVRKLPEAYQQLPIFEHSDPLILKHVLGRARCVVGSRFHALVSALSQGVPCIGAGWSHKYPELFKLFGCADMLVRDLADSSLISRLITEVANPSSSAELSERILLHAAQVKNDNDHMWNRVLDIIGSTVSETEPCHV